MRHSGIDVLGDVPWGTHVCQFYESGRDLLDILVGYFQRGLEDNELCVWVTAEPLGAEEARCALRQVVPDLDERAGRGQIEFLDYRQWYLLDGRFDAERVLRGWIDKERTALAQGYEGLRVTGNAVWLSNGDREAFFACEECVNRAIGSHRMLAVCAYPADHCRGIAILDILRNHPLALIKKDGVWQVVESPPRRDMAESLQESEERFSTVFRVSPIPMGISRFPDGPFVVVNDGLCDLFGYSREEVLGRTSLELDLWPDRLERSLLITRLREQGRVQQFETRLRRKSGEVSHLLISAGLIELHGESHMLGILTDISDRRRAELALEDRLRFEQLLTDLSATLVAGTAEEIDHAIDQGLKALVAFLQVDRANVSEFSADRAHASRTHSASAPGIEPLMPDTVPAAELPWYAAQLLAGKTVVSNRLPDDLPAEAVLDRQYCIKHGITSNVGIPLKVGASIVGLLVFQVLTGYRHWQPVIIARLQLIAEVFANALVRKQTERALRDSERQYRRLFDNMLTGLMVCEAIYDADGQPCDFRLVQANGAFDTLTGLSAANFLGKTSKDLPFGWPPELLQRLYEVARTGEAIQYERYNETLGRHYETYVFSPRPGFFAHLFRDITARKRAEEEKREMERRLLHAQKLESLGILAGGIAHDFNNILAGIIGYADLARMRLAPGDRTREDLEVIVKAARRAADLTRQMLAYSGKGQFIIAPLDISQLVHDARDMLAVSVSKKATLHYHLAAGLPAVEADAAQIHQVIMNLVVNASESLGENCGEITLVTGRSRLNEAECAALTEDWEMRAGDYVWLEVTDTGCGMDSATREKIFDPFFSTKFTGRGLGLAAVHGIVRGHKGAIRVASEAGRGTTFRVFFPGSDEPASRAADESLAASWHGSGTVLIVDDEEIIRRSAASMIEDAGFSVLTAVDGEDAVEVFRRRHAEISCVLLDLTMPKLDGIETLCELRRISPQVRVILSSGYSEAEAMRRLPDLQPTAFIEKPYGLDTLLGKLRDAIGPRG